MARTRGGSTRGSRASSRLTTSQSTRSRLTAYRAKTSRSTTSSLTASRLTTSRSTAAPLKMPVLAASDVTASPSTISRRKRPKTLKYCPSDLERAVLHVKSNATGSVRAAAKLFKVPRTTLRDRISGRIAIDAKPGRKSILNVQLEEKQLLVLDGHDSHNFLELIDMAILNNIHIVEMPAHTSHWLQPCDRTIFKPLKDYYRSSAQELMSSFPGIITCRSNFTGLFATAWERAMTATNILSGFRACGIFPFNPSEVPSDAYLPNYLHTVENIIQNSNFNDDTVVETEEHVRFPSTSHDLDESYVCIQPLTGQDALHAVEKQLAPEQLTTYNYLFINGFELAADDSFMLWRSLKMQSETVINGLNTTILAEPVVSSAEQVVCDVEPVVGDAEPVVCDAERVVGDAEPVVGDAEPVVGDAEPVVGDAERVVCDAEPVVGDVAPVICDAEPVVCDAERVVCDAEPVVGDVAPVICDAEPVVCDAERVICDAERVVCDAEPVVCDAEPVVDDAEPVVSSAEPVISSAEQVVYNAEPVFDNTEPVLMNNKSIASNRCPPLNFPFSNSSYPGDGDDDVLPYPVPSAKKKTESKGRQLKFFVLTSEEAHAAKLKYKEDKEQQEKEKLERKKNREIAAAARKLQKAEKEARSEQRKVQKTSRSGTGNSKKRTKKETKGKEKHSSKSEIDLQSGNCTKCGKLYGAVDDEKKEDEWLKCLGCMSWYHESCAEECGILDDLHFTCKGCA